MLIKNRFKQIILFLLINVYKLFHYFKDLLSMMKGEEYEKEK